MIRLGDWAQRDWPYTHVGWRIGLLWQPSALWVGVHYSHHNQRWCVNLVPFLTVWVCKPYGKVP